MTWRRVLARLAAGVPALLVVTGLVFAIVRLIPGDPARILAGDFATDQMVRELRERWQLDRPWPVQYVTYLRGLLRGDLGRSTATSLPVAADLVERFLGTLALAAAATVIGVLVGGLAGGWLDRVTMRLVDILVSFPTILLAIIVITIFGPGLRNAMIAIGIAQVPLYARLTRGAVMKVKALDYVLAARASGARESRVLWRHVVPNCLPPLLVQSTLFFATAILSAAYLGFLGLGAQPPTAEWGTMLSKARDFLRVAPHVSIFPGLTIMITVIGLNLLGDGLRDVIDPRTRIA